MRCRPLRYIANMYGLDRFVRFLSLHSPSLSLYPGIHSCHYVPIAHYRPSLATHLPLSLSISLSLSLYHRFIKRPGFCVLDRLYDSPGTSPEPRTPCMGSNRVSIRECFANARLKPTVSTHHTFNTQETTCDRPNADGTTTVRLPAS